MKYKVLVVEDEKEILEDILTLLELSGYEGLGAENGEKALDIIEVSKPDLIISDIMMPVLDGIGLLNELQKHEHTASIPFLFLTARTDKHSVREGMNLGADDYITKPFNINELISAIETRIRKKENFEEKYHKKLESVRISLRNALPHEIRTPLNTIIGFSDLILKTFEIIPPGEIKEMVSHINKSAKRLNILFEKYLFLAKIESLAINTEELSHYKNHTTPSTKSDITETANLIAKTYKRENDIQLELIDLEIPIPEEFFVKIMEEIIDNSFKFSHNSTPITIKSYTNDNSFFVEIFDKGRGISPDDIYNIDFHTQFERKMYEQQGTGLGLTIVKKILNIFHGNIKIESSLNDFTKVIITFAI